MTVYADNRPVTDTELEIEFGFIKPDPAEHVAWLIENGYLTDAYDAQQRQIKEGQRLALDGELFFEGWPAATKAGYAEALQDMEH